MIVLAAEEHPAHVHGHDPSHVATSVSITEWSASRLARNPTGRFGKPEEIVHMAISLASDESRWTNGAALVLDGGISVNYF